MDEQNEKRSRLARDVLRLSRNQILVNLRFLDAALSRLTPVETDAVSFATDGQYLAYDPRHVLLGYKADRAAPVRDYLHAVLHCVYRHMFVHSLVDQAAWDLACDIAVEHSITQLGLRAAEAAREARQGAVYQQLQKDVGLLTAEKVYRYLLDHPLHPIRLIQWQELFRGDDHAPWYMTDEEKAAIGMGGGSGGEDDSEGNGDGSVTVTVYGSEADWREISERMQIDMASFSKGQGKDPGAQL